MIRTKRGEIDIDGTRLELMADISFIARHMKKKNILTEKEINDAVRLGLDDETIEEFKTMFKSTNLVEKLLDDLVDFILDKSDDEEDDDGNV